APNFCLILPLNSALSKSCSCISQDLVSCFVFFSSHMMCIVCISFSNSIRIPVHDELALFNPNTTVRHVPDGCHRVAYEEDTSCLGSEFIDPSLRSVLELRIASV